MGSIRVDATRWPLFIATFPAGGVLVPDVVAFYANWQSLIEERGAHVSLIDCRAINPLLTPANIRRCAGEEVTKRAELFNRYTLAEARVVDNAVVRGLVTAFDWVTRSTLTVPTTIVATVAEAERWLAPRVEEARQSTRSRQRR
jgi:hypothetical protein